MDAQEEDFSTLSIADRLQHKLWKARVSACEELAKLFQTTDEDSDFYAYESHLKKLVIEPNAIAQEAGLSALFEYVSNAPNALNTREEIIPALVEKGLSAMKAGAKQKATDTILLYAELDTPNPVVELVLPGTNAKQPKLITQTVIVLKELVRQFGTKKVSPKPIIKVLPKLFGHSDKNVRAETFNLTLELYRWIGPALMPSLQSLKPVQIKDLEKAFEGLPEEKPVPERLTRAEQLLLQQQEEEAEAASATAASAMVDGGAVVGDAEDMDEEEMDSYDFADPKDITANLAANFYELLASKNWKERKEALDALTEEAKTPKILDTDYSELMAALAKRINDSNVLLVQATAQCVELIANGLRTDFSKYKAVIAPVMIEKLKERKPAVLEQLANGLNAVFATVPLAEVVEDVTVASKHKNPQVRSQCFKLVSRRLREIKEMPSKTEVKAFAEMFKKVLDDGDANARDAGAEGLGTLMKLIGEKPMLAFTEGLDDIKMKKIKEVCDTVTVKAKSKKKAAAPPPSAKSKTPTKPAMLVKKKAPAPLKVANPVAAEPMAMDTSMDQPISPPKRKPPSRLAGASSLKKPALSSSTKTKPFPAPAPLVVAEESAGEEEDPEEGEDDDDYDMDPYDLADPVDITEKLPANLYELLESKNWKERKEALDAITEQAKTPKILDKDYSELMTALSKRINDANVLLVGSTAQCVELMANGLRSDFGKYKPIIAPVMIDKLKERKPAILEQLANSLNAVFATVPLSEVVEDVAVASKHKNPQVRSEIFKLVSRRLREIKELPSKADIKTFAELFKKLLDDSDGNARDAGAEGLGTLMKLIGEKPMAIFTEGLDDIKTKKIKEVCEKVTVKAKPVKKAKPAPAPRATAKTLMPAKKKAPTASLTKPKTTTAAAHQTVPRQQQQRPESSGYGDHLKSPSTPSRMKSPASAAKKKGIASSPSAAFTSPARSQAASSTVASNESASPPIITNDPRAKQLRAKKEIRWQFDTLQPEFIDRLKSLFESNFSPEVTSLLFSKSQYAEKDRLSALTVLSECLEMPDVCNSKYNIDETEMKQRYIANADLIFKYLTLRFFDTNTSMLIKCLDLTQNLIAIMEEEGYQLTEYEAVSFLPFLINKVGDPKEVMRKRIRQIFKSVCQIYSPTKLFNYLLDSAASSKNAKARAECLEEVGSLIQTNGLSVMMPSKALPAVAVHIGDKDAGVRNAALTAIAQAYILMGDPVMKYMTKLGAKEKSMLEERLKRTKPSASVLAQQEREQRAKQEAEEMDTDELPSLPRRSGLSSRPRSNIATPKRIGQPTIVHNDIPEPEPMEDVTDDYGRRIPEQQNLQYSRNTSQMRYQQTHQSNLYQQHAVQKQQYQSQPQSIPTNYDSQRDYLDYIIAQISSNDAQSSIEALKNLDKMLASQPELIKQEISRLILAIALQVRLAYTNLDNRQPLSVRLCKHLVNALVLLFSSKNVAQSIPHEALRDLIKELAYRLLDQNMLALESGSQLSKALNVAMVKILENSSRNVTLSALLTILNESSAKLRPNDQPNSLQTKYTELIMKCLWKLAKIIPDSLMNNSLNVDHLLFEINEFFLTTPPAEWKRRAADKVPLGEMPLRTVKTLLLELVNGLGHSIFRHLSLISEPQKSSVYPYLHHMLEACKKKQSSEHQQPQNHTILSPVQHQQQQQQYTSEGSTNNRYLTQSRNSSLDRPTSMSSYHSDAMVRSPSDASQHSPIEAEHNSEAHHPQGFQHASSPVQDTNYSPSTPQDHNVQPMQIDTPPANNKSGYPAEYEWNLMLTKIFKKIGDREQTKQGVIELYEFQKRYPNAESRVKVYLNQTTPFFQSYIQRCLSNLEAEDLELHAAAATAASAAVATAAANVSRFTAERHSQIFNTATATISNNTASSLSSPRLSVTSPSLMQQQQSPHSPERNSLDEQQQASKLSRPSPPPSMYQQHLQQRVDARASDDTAEIKLRLLRLQQKFGYRTEAEESGTTAAAGLATSGTVPQVQQQNTSMPQSSSRRQSGLFQERESSRMEVDRQQALKEKIAKMKQVINSAASSSDI